jgi:hypothetical protein
MEMDFDIWCEIYKPIKNHIDTNASFDGAMFETYGEELEFVKSQDPAYIWMYGDGDDGGGYIWNGWHFVNRIGYFITEVPCSPNMTIQVKVDIPYYYCEGCDSEWEDEDNLISDKFGELGTCPACTPLDILQTLE